MRDLDHLCVHGREIACLECVDDARAERLACETELAEIERLRAEVNGHRDGEAQEIVTLRNQLTNALDSLKYEHDRRLEAERERDEWRDKFANLGCANAILGAAVESLSRERDELKGAFDQAQRTIDDLRTIANKVAALQREHDEARAALATERYAHGHTIAQRDGLHAELAKIQANDEANRAAASTLVDRLIEVEQDRDRARDYIDKTITRLDTIIAQLDARLGKEA